MEIENIFDYCNGNDYVENVIVYFSDTKSMKTINSCFTFAIDLNTKNIITYSNEYLYLIRNYYDIHKYFCMYEDFIEYHNNVFNNLNNLISIEENVLHFIPTFFSGTIHGYAAIFCMIHEYIKNKHKYEDLKIIIASNTCKSIFELINHFICIDILDRKNIIFLEPNKIYKFKSVKFIPNKYHTIVDDDSRKEVSYLIDNYLINKKFNLENASDEFDISGNKNLCILKHDKSINTTNTPGTGFIKYEIAKNFMEKYSLTEIEGGKIDEITLINIINSCEFLVLSFGSNFDKNHLYIGNNCKKIIVLVYTELYIKLYLDFKQTLFKYKNADIIYKIVKEDLSDATID